MSRVEEALNNRARGTVRIVLGAHSRTGDLNAFSREDLHRGPDGRVSVGKQQALPEPAKAEPGGMAPNRTAATPALLRTSTSAIRLPAERGVSARPTFHLSEAVQGKVVISVHLAHLG